MFRSSNNPKIPEITKIHRKRYFNLSDLEPIIGKDGLKVCLWCFTPLAGKKYKWCSLLCIQSALAWARPQSSYALNIILVRQNFKCIDCDTSYKDYMNLAINNLKKNRYYNSSRIKSKKVDYLIRSFKRLVPSEIRPEIDHVIPVSLGGPCLGIENHQILCRPCHKIKTKKENKERYEKNGSPIKGRKQTEEHRNALSIVRKGFDSPKRIAHRESTYVINRIKIIAINLKTKEEISFISIIEAARHLNLQQYNISRVLRGDQNRKQHKGWSFRYQT